MGGFAGFCMRSRQTRQAFRRVQMGGLFFTRLRMIFCRKVTSRVRLGMGGFLFIIHDSIHGWVVR
jgi:hypothetical protein